MRNLSFRGLGIAPFYSAKETLILEHISYTLEIMATASTGLYECEQLSNIRTFLKKQLPCHRYKIFASVSKPWNIPCNINMIQLTRGTQFNRKIISHQTIGSFRPDYQLLKYQRWALAAHA